jgi:hypothetical protein
MHHAALASLGRLTHLGYRGGSPPALDHVDHRFRCTTRMFSLSLECLEDLQNEAFRTQHSAAHTSSIAPMQPRPPLPRLDWNSVTRRPLAPPRPDWPVRRGLTSKPSATATRGRRLSSPRRTPCQTLARIVIAITRLPRRPARCALPSRLPRRFSSLAVVESGQRGAWLHRGNG